MKTYLTNSPSQTKDLAKNLAKKLKGKVILLTGELGSGKTVFACGFAKGLGIKDKIQSPTFVLIRQYILPKGGHFFHIDLYRIEKSQLGQLGIKEISAAENTVLIEWGEKLEKIPKNAVRINIDKEGSSKRKLVISD